MCFWLLVTQKALMVQKLLVAATTWGPERPMDQVNWESPASTRTAITGTCDILPSSTWLVGAPLFRSAKIAGKSLYRSRARLDGRPDVNGLGLQCHHR